MLGKRMHSRASVLVLLFHLACGSAAFAQPAPGPSPPVAKPQYVADAERLYPAAISHLLEDGQKAAAIVGIIAAGVWAYFNFFRGRTYRPRLEPHVSGAIFSTQDSVFLVAAYQVKNVGLSKVDIQQCGSALSVLVPEMPSTVPFVREIKWKHVATFDIFKARQWVEPGEPIQEQRLIALPHDKYLAVRIEVRLVSSANTEWTAMAIVSSKRLNGPQVDDGDLKKGA